MPVYDKNGALMRCHDPIIATSTIGGRCLVQNHCEGLRNSICQNDLSVKLPNGMPIKTCQCMEGYSDQRFGCEEKEEIFDAGFWNLSG